MPRSPSSPYRSSISFGPGPLSLALKALIGLNVAVFLADQFLGRGLGLTNLPATLGLMPATVIQGLQVWRLATYMFLHGGIARLLFNMLGLWMFGAELERVWGTRYFLKFYFLTGIGSAALTVVVSVAVFPGLFTATIIGASGAIYGLLLAYGLHFPNRPIYMYLVFPIPAKYFVLIMGAIAFYSSLADNSGIASVTHLGGIIVGYAMLRGGRLHPLTEAKYWYLRWKMNRVRRKFDVYEGGRSLDRPSGRNRRMH